MNRLFNKVGFFYLHIATNIAHVIIMSNKADFGTIHTTVKTARYKVYRKKNNRFSYALYRYHIRKSNRIIKMIKICLYPRKNERE